MAWHETERTSNGETQRRWEPEPGSGKGHMASAEATGKPALSTESYSDDIDGKQVLVSDRETLSPLSLKAGGDSRLIQLSLGIWPRSMPQARVGSHGHAS